EGPVRVPIVPVAAVRAVASCPATACSGRKEVLADPEAAAANENSAPAASGVAVRLLAGPLHLRLPTRIQRPGQEVWPAYAIPCTYGPRGSSTPGATSVKKLRRRLYPGTILA